jgi:hypothetical protein
VLGVWTHRGVTAQSAPASHVEPKVVRLSCGVSVVDCGGLWCIVVDRSERQNVR